MYTYVVSFREFARRLQHLQAHHLVATLLEAADNIGHQPALHAVGLDHDEGHFIGHFGWFRLRFDKKTKMNGVRADGKDDGDDDDQ